MLFLLASQASEEGGGVNVLPIALVVLALLVVLFLWRRK